MRRPATLLIQDGVTAVLMIAVLTLAGSVLGLGTVLAVL